MQEPTGCILWTEPTRILRGAARVFDEVECYVQESHFSQRLLRCRECGQLYFAEFFEDIDWVDGDDPQYWIYTLVADTEDCEKWRAGKLDSASAHRPRLHLDFPKGEDKKAYWTRD